MKKILVCLDGSPRQPHVIATASELARTGGAKLILFRAVGLPSEPLPDEYLKAPDDLETVLEKRAHAALETIRQELPAERVLRTEVEIGAPWQAIVRVASKESVDMIVMGSHGYDLVDKVLGTTAAKVVNHADRSVLVVREKPRVGTA